MRNDKGQFIKLYTEEEAQERQKASEARYRAKKRKEREALYEQGATKTRLEGTPQERYRLRRRKAFWEIKSNLSCIDCGISDPRVIDFDHINPSTKSFMVGKAVQNGTPWKLVLEEIDKCEPRCANCHRIRTHDQFNLSADLIAEDVDVDA